MATHFRPGRRWTGPSVRWLTTNASGAWSRKRRRSTSKSVKPGRWRHWLQISRWPRPRAKNRALRGAPSGVLSRGSSPQPAGTAGWLSDPSGKGLETGELAMTRTAVIGLGGSLLEELRGRLWRGPHGRVLSPPGKTIDTVVGPVRFGRAYYGLRRLWSRALPQGPGASGVRRLAEPRLRGWWPEWGARSGSRQHSPPMAGLRLAQQTSRSLRRR